MILVVTSRDDLTADWLIVELRRRGTCYLRLNTEEFPQTVGLVWRSDDGARLDVHGRRFPLCEFRSVWFRRPLPPVLDGRDPAVRDWAMRESQEALDSLWATWSEPLWVNHPDENLAAGIKLEQLTRAESLGFDIPASLLTNELDEARSFAADRAAVVSKPLTHGLVEPSTSRERVYWTTRIGRDELEHATTLGPEPYLFQELIEKSYDVRVTVIGDAVFAVRIESQDNAEASVDWRRGGTPNLRHEVEQLPTEIEERCLAFVKSYALQFGAIDLARRPDGGYTFFELNPNGQWAWLEQRTGLPMRARLADLLEAA